MKSNEAKPFVKWAGGKRQLLPIINENLPEEIYQNKLTKYIEPFVGGGAVLFNLISKFDFKEIIINDYNEDLINLYRHIKNNVENIIDELVHLSNSYLVLNEDDKAKFYYEIREMFNSAEIGSIEKSVYFIFLNRTCFNGLYRVNRNGKFNVPHGKYKKPLILDKKNLLNVSNVLQNVKIMNGDFTRIIDYVDNETFIYFDPPYRPLNITSSFTSYVKSDFNDDEQIRLSTFFKELDKKNAKLMLSNSDPKNTNINDNFFENLYGFNNNINIQRVHANRSINSKGNGRGKITELLITNY